MLAAQGPAGLSLRKLAASTGTSTMAIYTLFGDKQGLLSAMHRTGFARLGSALRASIVGRADPLEALAALGLAYRASALASPHLYGLMFGPALPDVVVDREVAEAAYAPLVGAVEECLEARVLTGATAQVIAEQLWAISHGMVSLELARQLRSPDPATAYTEALVRSVTAYLPTGA